MSQITVAGPRDLTLASLKRLNSSLHTEIFVWVCLDHELPGGFEDCIGAEALPVGDVEGAVHVGEAAVAFHDEIGGLILHCVF